MMRWNVFLIGLISLVLTGCTHSCMDPGCLASDHVQVALKNPERVVFLAVGDQGTGKAAQQRVAHAMEKQARAMEGVDFVLLLGDNFYPTGVSSVSDPQWRTAFEHVYTGETLSRVPFYALIGNHDGYGNPQAELLYHRYHPASRWQMRACQDRLVMGKGPGGEPLLQLVLLDSTGSVASQADYARQALDKQKAVWQVVAAHYPFRSSGRHGSSQELIDNLLNKVLKNRVDLFLSGHDHDQEVIQLKGEPLQVVSGAGGSDLYVEYNPVQGSQFFDQTDYGFAQVVVTAREIQLTLLDEDAKVLYQTSLKR
ncbi:MAG: metallophosphoesterase [Magnetococcales bacterium]|nr:metallophosphoesterase [Magnetococcales bacterium]